MSGVRLLKTLGGVVLTGPSGGALRFQGASNAIKLDHILFVLVGPNHKEGFTDSELDTDVMFRLDHPKGVDLFSSGGRISVKYDSDRVATVPPASINAILDSVYKGEPLHFSSHKESTGA